MSVFYKSLKRLFDSGKASPAVIANGVRNGYITAEEYRQITGQAYEG